MMLQRLAVLLCAAGLTVACGQSDAGITTSVKSKLAADDTVKAYEIDVDTSNRVVTLTGEVATSAAKEQAIQIARDTEGVRNVVDQLRVAETAATTGVLDSTIDDRAKAAGQDAGRKTADAADRAGVVVTDAAITSAVKAKLLGDPDVSGLKIDVDTNDGVVTLSGDVKTKVEANEAMRLARTTEGVRDVVSKLRVR
jgi:hyperosmotically inducible periplasmic protein